METLEKRPPSFLPSLHDRAVERATGFNGPMSRSHTLLYPPVPFADIFRVDRFTSRGERNFLKESVDLLFLLSFFCTSDEVRGS